MKKRLIIILSVLLIFVTLIVILFFIKKDSNKIEYTADEIKFKDEYENINGYELKEGYILNTININIDNNVKYVDDNELIKILKKGNNVIYFGWSDCNWCRTIVPILTNVVREENINLYYYDLKSLRNNYENDIDKEKVKLYEDIIKIIGKDIDVVFDENSLKSGEKKILAPTVVFIKNGRYLKQHVKSLDSHKNSSDKLTDNQINELTKIYKTNINELKENTCNEGC